LGQNGQREEKRRHSQMWSLEMVDGGAEGEERERGGGERERGEGEEMNMDEKTFLPLIFFSNECHVCKFNGKYNRCTILG
jgi:hypothetical protein